MKIFASARNFLVMVWFVFLIINLGIIFYLYFDKWIERDSFLFAIKQLNGNYAPYIGTITLFYWGSTRKPSPQGDSKGGIPFALAIICSMLWNGMILLFLIPLLFQSGTIEEAIGNIHEIGDLLAWLVAGSIGYYFANPTVTKVEKQKMESV